MGFPPICAALLRWSCSSSTGTMNVLSRSTGTAFAARVGKPWCRTSCSSRICKRGGMGRATRAFDGSSDEMRANDSTQSINGLHAQTVVLRNGYCANHRGYHKGRTPARRTCKSTPPMRCGESFRRRWPRHLECRGWICQETLCDRSSVIFDLRQCALKTFIDGVATARHGTGNRPDILCRRR